MQKILSLPFNEGQRVYIAFHVGVTCFAARFAQWEWLVFWGFVWSCSSRVIASSAFMVHEVLKPLPGHAVFLLFMQLAVVLIAARIGAELSKRIGLPTVVGELLAGIVVGPSVFGHYLPGASALIFPRDSAQFHLLEVIGNLGMVLLLLLTGLETDLRLLKNLGRAAFIASVMGMCVPFATGFGLGMVMPDEYLAQPDRRMLFSFFLATAMAVSAMPVIAKILMDLDLTRRNIGLVILSAGVVDDTAGWVILSAIAGVASHGKVQVEQLFATLILMVAFLVCIALLVYPFARRLMSIATRRLKSQDSDLVFLLVITFLCAAATEWIGVHAAFGAFIAGTLFRQIPEMRSETIHRLESFVFSVLAPIFFGIVGLKVNLWTLHGWQMLVVVLAVACFGKLVGCTVGSIWGGLRFWEGLSIAVAMNARGAVELVVATIGLSLGILNSQMFSIIVVVAVVTSFMAPIGLRLTVQKVRMTEEEERRILAERSKGFFDPDRVRTLVATTGGRNTLAAARLAMGISRRSVNSAEIFRVRAPVSWRDWLSKLFRSKTLAPSSGDEAQSVEQLSELGLASSMRSVTNRDVAGAILTEAHKGFDLLVLGASQRGDSLGGSVLEEVVQSAPCHVAIVRSGASQEMFQRVLVPYDGGVFSRVAVEFAVRYAEVTDCSVTVAILREKAPETTRYATEFDSFPVLPQKPRQELDLGRISGVFHTTEVRPTILDIHFDPISPTSHPINDEIARGNYDLVAIGAENRAIQHRLFFGYQNDWLIRSAQAAVAIIVPNVALLR